MGKVDITIFQAPYSCLIEHGLYLKMRDFENPFQGNVPVEYYLMVFNGSIDCPDELSEDPDIRDREILECAFTVFNIAHPAGYCGRSLSVGDVVGVDGRYYLCAPVGFHPVTFTASTERLPVMPEIHTCEVLMPDGIRVQATAHQESDYPCINIDLITETGGRTRICFVEYNPQQEFGHELCIGVYCSGDDETVYYDSYYTDTECEVE